MDKRNLSTEEFIRRSKLVHGDKYEYSKVLYECSKNKVIIVCEEHGDFLLKPNNHLNGKQGCKSCSTVNKKHHNKLSKEIFIDRAISKHGNKFCYDKVEYKRINLKVCISCKIHGDFLQTPQCHLASQHGCTKCGDIEARNTQRKTLINFIKDAEKVHGSRYDYSRVDYKGSLKKVILVCKLHGSWMSTPSKHLGGGNCPSCAKGGFSRVKAGIFYILSNGDITKVGITRRFDNSRLKEIIKSSKIDFKKIKEYKLQTGALCIDTELKILKYLEDNFQKVTTIFDGSTECFQNVNLPDLIREVEKEVNNG